MPARLNALLVAVGRILINFKAKPKAAAPILRHVFAVEKTKCVISRPWDLGRASHFYSARVWEDNHLQNVRELLDRQLVQLLRLCPAPFQYHTFRAETTVRTHSTQPLPDRNKPKYIVLTRQKERARLPRLSWCWMRQTLRITIYAQRDAPSY